MTRINHPTTQKFRNLVALLHPGSAIRFVLEDGTELSLIAAEKSQQFTTTDKGNDAPTEAPAMTVFLRRIPTFEQRLAAAEETVKKLVPSKTIRHLEKAPPNSGG